MPTQESLSHLGSGLTHRLTRCSPRLISPTMPTMANVLGAGTGLLNRNVGRDGISSYGVWHMPEIAGDEIAVGQRTSGRYSDSGNGLQNEFAECHGRHLLGPLSKFRPTSRSGDVSKERSPGHSPRCMCSCMFCRWRLGVEATSHISKTTMKLVWRRGYAKVKSVQLATRCMAPSTSTDAGDFALQYFSATPPDDAGRCCYVHSLRISRPRYKKGAGDGC